METSKIELRDDINASLIGEQKIAMVNMAFFSASFNIKIADGQVVNIEPRPVC